MGNIAYIMHIADALAARHGRRDEPLRAFLFLQGLETLHLRMPRHCENALAVARVPRGARRRSSG